MDNSRILIIPDLHFPYAHPDCIDFLAALKKKIKPTRVICLGDELDYHAMSFHDKDPDLESAGTELLRALGYIETLIKLFPKMDLMESNHGSMAYRKAKHHGIPRHLLKSYNDVLDAPKTWRWHEQLIINLPDKSLCLFSHTIGANIGVSAPRKGMSCVQGHHHEKYEIVTWDNGIRKMFGISSGCLIDNRSYAFAYNKLNPNRPMIGASGIIDSEPVLYPMKMDKFKRWTGKL